MCSFQPRLRFASSRFFRAVFHFGDLQRGHWRGRPKILVSHSYLQRKHLRVFMRSSCRMRPAGVRLLLMRYYDNHNHMSSVILSKSHTLYRPSQSCCKLLIMLHCLHGPAAQTHDEPAADHGCAGDCVDTALFANAAARAQGGVKWELHT